MNDNSGHWRKCLNKDLPYALIIVSSCSCRASMNSYAGAELAFLRSRSLPSLFFDVDFHLMPLMQLSK
jgi:hypothetical protein